MATRAADVMSRAVRELSQAEVSSLCDRNLLERFADADDQAAFSELVTRHSRMVLGVCKRVLHTHQDAEDACQAVFLILSRNAKSHRWQASLGNWLYTTARKVAHNARRAAIRRAAREGRAAKPDAVAAADLMTGRELVAVLDEELDKLAPRYREPLVLCYLEGLTRDEAASRLGVPHATLKSQLERGRRKLADALTARGWTLGVALLATAATTTTRASSPKLVDAILTTVYGSPSNAVATLARGGTMTGVLNKTMFALLALVGVGVVGLGLAAARPDHNRPEVAESTPATETTDEPNAKPATGDGKPAAGANDRTFTGKVLDANGKPVPAAKVYYCFRDQGTTPVPVRATTDPNGQFTFTLRERDIPTTHAPTGGDPVSGGFLVAKAEGHTWAWERVNLKTSEMVLTCAADTIPVRGRIVDLQGKPIPGVRVVPLGAAVPTKGDISAFLKTLEKDQPVPFAMVLQLTTSFWHDFSANLKRPSPLLPATTTDAEGRFRLDGFGANQIVELRLEGDIIETTELYFVCGKPVSLPAPKNKPGGLNPRPLVMKANGDDVAAAPGLVVTGVVRDALSGKPVPGAIVEIYHLAGRPGIQSSTTQKTTDAQGQYRLGGLPLAHGSQLRIRGTGDEPYLPTVKGIPETKLFVPATLDVTLDRGVWVDITTIDRATGKPIPGAITYFVARDDKKETPGRAQMIASGYDRTMAVPSDGRFRLAIIPDRAAVLAFTSSPGRLDLSKYPIAADATKPERASLLSAVNYNAFVDVNPKAGSGPIPVQFTLDSSRRVEGKLTGPDGQPVSGVLATGLLHDWYIQSTLPLRSAEFGVLGVEPTHPRLVCFVQPQLNLAGSVVVRGDEKGPLLIKLQAAASVKGRLVDDGGRPVKQAYLDFIELPFNRNGEYHSTETGVLIRDRLPTPSSSITTIKKDGTVTTTDLSPEMSGLRLNTMNADGSVSTTGGPRGAIPVTDAEGHFTITGLVPGLKYHLVWKDRPGMRASETNPWKGIVFRDVIFKAGEAKDLGDVKTKPFPEEKK